MADESINTEISADIEKVNEAIRMEVPLIMTTYTAPRKVERYIEQVVSVFLDHVKQSHLKDNVVYCIQELVVNAKKANTKRAYFSDRGLDVHNSKDYEKGMETFKEETLKNIDYFLEIQRQQGLYIKLVLQLKDDALTIEVRNNASITMDELERIRSRIIKAKECDELEEAIVQVLDDSEGAGLGLVMLVIMLKKLGLGTDAFDILRSNDETIARILIPVDTK
jgi:hypothetical protein